MSVETNPEQLICSLCNEPILPDEHGWAGGHNPAPLMKHEDDRCCEKCNWEKVIPARLGRYALNEQMEQRKN